MRSLAVFVVAGVFWLTSLVAVLAQEDDKGFLTRTLQDALSGAGRAVSIDGFRGALSSAASFDRMTIADADGVWLTLEGVVLEWNRSALLRGRLEVEQLTAQRLDLPRAPVAEDDALPDAEAAPFSLPDLPVSVDIEAFSIAQINLGAPLLGEEAQLSVEASAQLTSDSGAIDLVASRTDGQRGQFAIKASLGRQGQMLDVMMDLSEGDNGIAARVLGLPGQPSVDLNIQGAGPLDDFTADVAVKTEGLERLAGQITLGAQSPRRATGMPDRRIQADIGGDITALLAPRYRAFFGTDVRLSADALIEASGAIEVSAFDLSAQAANLRGRLALDADTWPVLIDIEGEIANPDGTPTLLPLGGEATSVQGVRLRIDYDVDDGAAIDADFEITDLSLPQAQIAQTTLNLDGTLESARGAIGAFLGEIQFNARGLALNDPALAEAIGKALRGRAQVRYATGAATMIEDLDLSGSDYGLVGSAEVSGLETGFSTVLDATLSADDISRFSALVGQEIAGQTTLALRGTVAPLGGQFDVAAEGRTDDLRVGIAQADAVLAGRTTLSLAARRNELGTFLQDVTLENAALSMSGEAQLRGEDSRVEAQIGLRDIAVVLPQYSGPVTVAARAQQNGDAWTVDAATDGPYGAVLTASGVATGPDALLRFTADVPEVRPFVPELEGPIRARGTLGQTPDGWRIDTQASGPYNLAVGAKGIVAPRIALDFDLSMPQVKPLVPQLDGPVAAVGRVEQRDAGYFISTDAQGPYGSKANVEGIATGPDMRLDFTASLPNIRPFAPDLSGAVVARGVVRQTPQGITIDTTASGPYSATASVQGLATGPDMRLAFEASVPNVRPFAPGVSGPLAARGVLRQTSQGIAVTTTASGPYALNAEIDGVVTGPNADVSFAASMPDIGVLVESINGPLRVSGRAQKAAGGWQVRSDADGPSGTQAEISGLVQDGGTLDVELRGTAPLGLSRPFLAPRDLRGLAQFDLRVEGPAALASVSGTVRTSGATFSAPNLRVALQDIGGTVTLARNRAQLDFTAAATNGGRLRAAGGIALTGALPADLQVGLNDVVVIDPRLYRTALSGEIRIAGPLRGGAVIGGQINIGETNVNVPSTGLTSIGDIPGINHIGATRPVMATRRKAGLEEIAGVDSGAPSSGTPYELNLEVRAPNRIFVRGRGIDAELGGGLRLTGTTARVISAGRFDLQRGRLDILGKRFDLREGSIQFQGGLAPFIRFVSATETSTGEVRVVVEGPADAPVVSFEATPDLPEDEVLAQLLFGRNISEISPLQALQLANAVATLAGRGGTQVIANLRAGFGLDDLDVTTTDDGTTAVRAGKYISDNVYTDVTAASDGTGEVSLNLDITPNLKGKATLGSDGNSGIGIFYEKDY